MWAAPWWHMTSKRSVADRDDGGGGRTIGTRGISGNRLARVYAPERSVAAALALAASGGASGRMGARASVRMRGLGGAPEMECAWARVALSWSRGSSGHGGSLEAQHKGPKPWLWGGRSQIKEKRAQNLPPRQDLRAQKSAEMMPPQTGVPCLFRPRPANPPKAGKILPTLAKIGANFGQSWPD